jgi:hypothetical protein
MEQPLTIFVDIDDTLVRSVGTKRIPIPAVVKAVRALHAEGAVLYAWSSGGADYARESSAELGIHDCFVGFLPKPDVVLDDQAPSEWRRLLHVHPLAAADASVARLRTERTRAAG